MTPPTWNGLMKAFPKLDWVDLGVSGKVWMCSFWKAKELGNPMVGSKVMASGNELVRFARFSRYLNHFDSDFDP